MEALKQKFYENKLLIDDILDTMESKVNDIGKLIFEQETEP